MYSSVRREEDMQVALHSIADSLWPGRRLFRR